MSGYAEKVKDLLPQIKARRAEIEQARQLPADLAEALRATGILSLGMPRAIGGEEVSPTDTMRVAETIATADGSTGWVAMIAMTANGAAGYMNEAGAKELFASDLHTFSASVAGPIGKAVRVDGGVRVSGHWPFASGVTHSKLIWLGAIVHENDKPVMTPHGPEIIHVWMPVTAGQIHDTWYTSGMAGTGSNDFSCDDAFVPDQLVWALFDPSGHRPEPPYQFPLVAMFSIHVGAVALGIARAALDELIELAPTKVPSLSMEVLADRPAAQIELARAEARLEAARAFLYDSVEDVYQTLVAGRAPTERQVASGRVAPLHAVETAGDVTRTANVLTGGTAIYSKYSTQRHARDAEVLQHHFTVAQHVWEDAGRVLLGRAPLAPIF